MLKDYKREGEHFRVLEKMGEYIEMVQKIHLHEKVCVCGYKGKECWWKVQSQQKDKEKD